MNHRTEPKADSPEQLIKNIQSLMDEVEAIVAKSADSDGIGGRVGDLKERFSNAKDQVQGYYKAARKRIVSGAQTADETIRSHPYESLAVALGLGVLIGALARRRD
jgi:ElaB/YqjD/DUF883 family membrane-anchored ribosome-binding protein